MTDFMQPETLYGNWYAIEGDNGTTFVYQDDVGEMDTNKPEDFLQYYEGNEVYEVEIKRGWGSRLNAPGYMDCTPWSVFETLDEAKEELAELYDVEVS